MSIDAAILALTADGVETYKLNTGQNVSQVTKINVPDLLKQRDALYKSLCRMQYEVDNAGLSNVVQVVPGY